jgi:hypothetical protein
MVIHSHLQVGCLPLMVCASDGTAVDTIESRGLEGKGNPAAGTALVDRGGFGYNLTVFFRAP